MTENGNDGKAAPAPRSRAALACALLGWLAMGLFVRKWWYYENGPYVEGSGILSLVLCMVPLMHRRAGTGAIVLGDLGLIAWVLIGGLTLYRIWDFAQHYRPI